MVFTVSSQDTEKQLVIALPYAELLDSTKTSNVGKIYNECKFVKNGVMNQLDFIQTSCNSVLIFFLIVERYFCNSIKHCFYVCFIYIYIYIYIYILKLKCLHIHSRGHTHTNIQTCKRTHTHTHTHTHIYIYIYV